MEIGYGVGRDVQVFQSRIRDARIEAWLTRFGIEAASCGRRQLGSRRIRLPDSSTLRGSSHPPRQSPGEGAPRRPGSRALPSGSGAGRRAIQLALPRLLPERPGERSSPLATRSVANHLPPPHRDSRAHSVARHAASEWRLHAGLQPAASAYWARLPGSVQGHPRRAAPGSRRRVQVLLSRITTPRGASQAPSAATAGRRVQILGLHIASCALRWARDKFPRPVCAIRVAL